MVRMLHVYPWPRFRPTVVPRVTRGHDPGWRCAPPRVRTPTGLTVTLDSYCSADALAYLYYRPPSLPLDTSPSRRTKIRGSCDLLFRAETMQRPRSRSRTAGRLPPAPDINQSDAKKFFFEPAREG